MPSGPDRVRIASCSLLLETDTSSTNWCGFGRPPLLGDVPGDHGPASDGGALPQPDEAVRRDEDDDEEDEADHGVEALADEADVRRVVVDDHEDERAQPCPFESVQPADD